jgi:ribosomal protein L40E
LVYCPKCGAENEDAAEKCVKCGASLYSTKRASRRRDDACFGPREERHFGEECFGLPYGGAIVGLLFGVIILILGAAWVVSLSLGIEIDVWKFIGPVVVIFIGALIVAGVVYGLSHRR